jgi:dolichol-phosphate mannosyltransferase
MNSSIVIIPTYNEIENVRNMIEDVIGRPYNFNILIVDDNSPDGTAAVVKELQEKYPTRLFMIQREGKLGLGTAYIAGFKWALEHEYKYIFEMDCDFSHDPCDLIRLRNSIDNGADLAIGSRYITGVNVVNWPILRVILSYCASKYVRFITRMKIQDTTAGFKCYRSEVLQAIPFEKIKFKGYAFQIEMKFTVWKYGFNIAEVPIIFCDRKLGSSKLSGGIFNEALWGVIVMKVKSLFRKYEIPSK